MGHFLVQRGVGQGSCRGLRRSQTVSYIRYIVPCLKPYYGNSTTPFTATSQLHYRQGEYHLSPNHVSVVGRYHQLYYLLLNTLHAQSHPCTFSLVSEPKASNFRGVLSSVEREIKWRSINVQSCALLNISDNAQKTVVSSIVQYTDFASLQDRKACRSRPRPPLLLS